jgi:hypothetical protein
METGYPIDKTRNFSLNSPKPNQNVNIHEILKTHLFHQPKLLMLFLIPGSLFDQLQVCLFEVSGDSFWTEQ